MVLFQTLQCRSGRGKERSSVGSQTLLSAQPQTLLKSGKGDLGGVSAGSSLKGHK